MLLVLALLAPSAARASSRPVEVHQLLALPQPGTKIAALTLDACGGGYDAKLIRFLVGERIPATVFATRKWIERNAEGVAMLRSHPELFDIEDHGANHVPAVIGLGRRVYGIAGNLDVAHRFGVTYVYVGREERAAYGADVLGRFTAWPVAFAAGNSTLVRVP